MPRLKAKAGNDDPPKTMTILHYFARQRDKQTFTVEKSPIGSQGRPTAVGSKQLTPKSVAKRPNSREVKTVPEVRDRNTRENAAKRPVSIGSACRNDNNRRRQTSSADPKNKTMHEIVTPLTAKGDVLRRSTRKTLTLIKSARRNLMSRMNECSPIAREVVKDQLNNHDANSEDDFVSTPSTSQESMRRPRTFQQALENTNSGCDNSDDDFVASSLPVEFRRRGSSSVSSTPVAKLKNHGAIGLTRRHSPPSKSKSPSSKKARMKSPSAKSSSVTSPFTRSVVVASPSTKMTNASSVVSPRSNTYLNLISNRFDNVRTLLRSPSEQFSFVGSHPATPSRTVDYNVGLLSPQLNSPMSANNDGDYDQNEDIEHYLRSFLNILKSALNFDEDYSLFDEDDMNVVRNFYLLSCNAQKLYVRLFARQYNWIPLSKMNYPEISENLENILQELKCNGFLESEENLTSLKTVLNILQVDQLKQLCRHLKIKPVPRKVAMVELIMNHCKQQKSVVAGLDVSQAVTIDAKKLLKGGYWRLLEKPRRIFIRIFMLYSLTDTNDKHEDRPFQLDILVRVNMGQLVYPSYNIFRRAKIFRFKNDLIRYETAYLLDCDIASAMEKKDWETAERFCAIAVEEFTSLFCDDSIINHDAELPTFLRKFTAGHLYVACICRRVEVLEKMRRYEEAVAQLEILLEQNIYCQRHKGHWTERLALNLDQHLDKPIEALRIIGKALIDPAVTDDHRLSLLQRAMRICKSKKLKALSKETLVLPSLPILKPTDVHIKGKQCKRLVQGGGTLFVATDSGNNFDVTVCSVEKFAILHYRSQGFPEGLHGEGSTLVSLFGLLFWDIIYCDDIPDAFRCNHQNLPLDLFSADFYSNREVKIRERIDLIKKSPMKELVKRMSETWMAHFEQMSIINWKLFKSFQKVQSLVACIGNEFLAEVCLRFATNYRHYRSGVPDIVVWNTGNGSWKMVEVKGPGDKLSHKQILWLHYLLENDVSAEVCYVKAISGKEIN